MTFKVNGNWEESSDGLSNYGIFNVSSFFFDEEGKEHYVEADDESNPLSVLVGGFLQPPYELAAKLGVEIQE